MILMSQPFPWNLFQQSPIDQMKKAERLVVDPDVSGRLFGNGMRHRAGHRGYATKPAILEKGNSMQSRNPDPPPVILIKGLQRITRQSIVNDLAHSPIRSRASIRGVASSAIDRDLAVIPSIQAIAAANPDAAIPGGQDGSIAGRQTLLRSNRGDRVVPKTVQTVEGRYPDAAFSVLKETSDPIPREAVPRPK